MSRFFLGYLWFFLLAGCGKPGDSSRAIKGQPSAQGLHPLGSLVADFAKAQRQLQEAPLDSNLAPTLMPPETKESIFQLLGWLAGSESQQYNLKIRQLPLQQKTDIEGDSAAFMEKLNSIFEHDYFSTVWYRSVENRVALKEIYNRLTDEQRRSLVLGTVHRPTAAGDSITFLNSFDLIGPLIIQVIEDHELAALFASLPESGAQVRWDGEKGRFVYDDEDLDYHVALLAMFTRLDASRSLKVFNDLAPEIRRRYQINLNTEDPKTHIEPFDLVQGSITRLTNDVLSNNTASRIVITKAIHRSLYKLWQLTPQQDPRGAVISDVTLNQSVEGREGEDTSILCAGFGELIGYDEYNIVNTEIISNFAVSSQQVHASNKNGAVKLRCGGLIFPIKSNPVSADPISLPDPYDILKIADKRAVSVLVNYALTEQTNPTLIAATIAYMTSKGYLWTGMKQKAKTIEVFNDAFTHADIFIPAAHVIDINHMQLGTEYSRILYFSRIIRHSSGRLIPVNITAIFPENKGSGGKYGTSLGIAELGSLMSQRRKQLAHSMFILTQSCSSGGAVISWTRAFRKSLELDIASGDLGSTSDAKDLTHAIAPKGGFPTDTPSQLILDFVPSLMSIEMLVKGQSPRQVFAALGKPIKPDLFTQAIAVIEKWFGIKAGDRGESLKLNPVYNIDLPHLLDTNGIILEIGQSEA